MEFYEARYRLTEYGPQLDSMPTIDVAAPNIHTNSSIGRQTIRTWFANLVNGETNLAHQPREVAFRVFGSLVVAGVPNSASFGRYVTITQSQVDGIDVKNHSHTGGAMGRKIPFAGLDTDAKALMFQNAAERADFLDLTDGGNADDLHIHHVDYLDGGAPQDLDVTAYTSVNHSHMIRRFIPTSSLGAPGANGLGSFYSISDFTFNKLPKRITLKPIPLASVTALSSLQYGWHCELLLYQVVNLYQFNLYGPLEVYATTSGAGDKSLIPNGLVGAGTISHASTDPTNSPTTNGLASPIRVSPSGSNYIVQIRDVEYWIKSGWSSNASGGYMFGKENLSDIPAAASYWVVEIEF